MTTREEIREGMRSHLKRFFTRCFGKEPEGLALDYLEHCLKNQEMWLASQGVVIKVEDNQPTTGGGVSIDDKDIPQKTVQCVEEGYFVKMKKAGYVAVESLIKEED